MFRAYHLPLIVLSSYFRFDPALTHRFRLAMYVLNHTVTNFATVPLAGVEKTRSLLSSSFADNRKLLVAFASSTVRSSMQYLD